MASVLNHAVASEGTEFFSTVMEPTQRSGYELGLTITWLQSCDSNDTQNPGGKARNKEQLWQRQRKVYSARA